LRGIPDFSIYINPGIYDPYILLDDTLHQRLAARVPPDLADLWQQPWRWTAPSDGLHTRIPGPDLLTVALDGTRVSSAVRFDGNQLVSLLGGRVTGGVLPLQAALPSQVAVGNEVAPPPRQQFATTASKRLQALFLAGGVGTSGVLGDLWHFDLGTRTWNEIAMVGEKLGRVLAMTYRASDGALYLVDEKKFGWFHLGRVLRVDLQTGKVEVLGAWPRIKAFDQFFLGVSQEGDLVLTASQNKTKKGRHAVAVFQPKSQGGVRVLWALTDHGALALAPTLTRDGLTRTFEDPDSSPPRFLPTNQLPYKVIASKPGKSKKLAKDDDGMEGVF
jgi:hypothetical protein